MQVFLYALLILTLPRDTAAREAMPQAAPQEPEAASPTGETTFDRHDPRTPAGAVRAFIDDCRSRDYSAAAARLDLSHLAPEERETEGPRLARQFKIVLDRKLWIQFERLSTRPQGDLDDGLPPDLDLVGTISDGVDVDVLVRRAPDAAGMSVWVFAGSTVQAIPALYKRFGYGKVGELLPRTLFEVSFLEVALAQWIGLVLLTGAAWMLAWLVVAAVRPVLRSIASRTSTDLDDRMLVLLSPPAVFLLALAIFAAGSYLLRLAAPVQAFLGGLETGMALVGVTWAVLRGLDVASDVLADRFDGADNSAAKAALPLARRTAKALLIVVAAIGLLQNLGFNVTGLIAGLGVGGLALALAAQKTIENLFGGVTLITDRPVRVGDFCRYGGDKLGTIEEIGLRSTRIRTLDRTLVTVPNAAFAELQIENFAPRDRVRLLTILGLRYETSADQLRFVLSGLRDVLIGHPRVCDQPLRVRFSGFGASSLDVEIFAYVETTDFNEFCAIREDLFLRFIDVVEQAGTAIAFPSQTLYLGRDAGFEAERVEQAENAVKEWREAGRLPFPEAAPDSVEEIRDRLDYPPTGSAVASG
jgi:MscS family membrane protein